MTDRSLLAGLFQEAFPAIDTLPAECWVRRAVEHDYDVWDEAIQEVTKSGGRSGAVRRLQLEHPSDREHVRDHDEVVQRVFTEIEAFAWTSAVSGLGSPQFVFDEGAPDLRVNRGAWIEAKTIQSSDHDRAQWERAWKDRDPNGIVMRTGPVSEVSPALLRKADYHFRNAIVKWERQGKEGELVVYMCLSQIDVDVDWDDARDALGTWAARAERETGARVVLIHNHNWRDPFHGLS